MEVLIGLFAFLVFIAGIAGIAIGAIWPQVTVESYVLDDAGKRIREGGGYGGFKTIKTKKKMPGRLAVLVLSPIIALAGFGLMGVRIIPPGNVGVVINAGQVDTGERSPGFSWMTPFVSDIKNFSTRLVAYHFEKLAAASKEYQDVFLTGTVNYSIAADGAAELFVQVGDDYESKLIVPFFNDIVKEVVPTFGISEILPNREQIRSLTVAKLQVKLLSYGIHIADVAFSNIDFNEAYNLAIQNKQIQELQIQTERNILAQKVIVAQQAKQIAAGQADAAIESARGQAQALLLVRQAEADGNKAVAASLTQPILTQLAIDKFNPNVKIVLMPPTGASSFIFPPEFITPEEEPVQ